MALRLLLLLRLVAFMAVIYLALHVAVARWSRKPGSKLLWFFEVVTAPLLRLTSWLAPAGTGAAGLRLWALGCFAALWLAALVLVERLARVS